MRLGLIVYCVSLFKSRRGEVQEDIRIRSGHIFYMITSVPDRVNLSPGTTGNIIRSLDDIKKGQVA